MSKKELFLFMGLDILEFILSVIGIFGFTFMFVALQTDSKYIFLVCDLYVIYVFISNWNSIGNYLKTIKLQNENPTSNTKIKTFQKI